MRIRMMISPSLSPHLVQPRKLQMLEAQFPRSAQAGPHRDLVCRGRTPWVRLRIALGHAVAFGFVVVLTRTMPLMPRLWQYKTNPKLPPPSAGIEAWRNSVWGMVSYRMMMVVVVENGGRQARCWFQGVYTDENKTPIKRFSDDSEHNQELKPCSTLPSTSIVKLCKIQFTFQTFAAIWRFDVSHC